MYYNNLGNFRSKVIIVPIKRLQARRQVVVVVGGGGGGRAPGVQSGLFEGIVKDLK